MKNYYITKLPVRQFVEFVCRSGSLDNRGRMKDITAMKDGVRLHAEIQGMQPDFYMPEIPLAGELRLDYNGEGYGVTLEGRADGIFRFNEFYDRFNMENEALAETEAEVFVDEIKCMYADIEDFKEPNPVHLAQAKAYAWMTGLGEDEAESDNENDGIDGNDGKRSENGGIKIGVQITYCNIDTKKRRYFTYEYTVDELNEWMFGLVFYYAKWMAFEKHHKEKRDASIKGLAFPFDYREGQRELVKNVYLTIKHKKTIFIEAPTGVGKTMSNVYPAVQAMGQGMGEKIFYATARSIARTVAEEAAGILVKKGAQLLVITLTAKEKLCIMEKPECNPEKCVRAKGHEDRVNEAVYDIITHETRIDRERILEYAEKHKVCPFEFALDVSLWCDMIICDYNYCFSPDVSLKRFFYEEAAGRYILLCDEAHNLTDRAREMYSAELCRADLLKIRPKISEKHEVKKNMTAFTRALNALAGNKLEERWMAGDEDIASIVVTEGECVKIFAAAQKLYSRLYTYVTDRKIPADDEVLEFFFMVRTFTLTLDHMDENYLIVLEGEAYTDSLKICLKCMNPRVRLSEYLSYHRARTFFSATLLPVSYYMDQLGGKADDYAVYAPSPFDPAKRKIIIAKDVSSKYTRRNAKEYRKMAEYIYTFVKARIGNYLVFFPSYKVMEAVNEAFTELRLEEALGEENPFFGIVETIDGTETVEDKNTKNDGIPAGVKDNKKHINYIVQRPGMTEEERENFLAAFDEDGATVGFCVMGGIFAEGIDLKADRLIGAAVVGTGLPMVGPERELIKGFYDRRSGNGFEYAYLFPGMNKVLQAGGRVIRTEEDRGVILLLDERFLRGEYSSLFPREWSNVEVMGLDGLKESLEKFWKSENSE